MSARIKEPSVAVHMTVPISWLLQMDALAQHAGQQRAGWVKKLIELELEKKARQAADRPGSAA